MRLALDARCLSQPLHGMARYTLNLLRELAELLGPEDLLLVIYNRQTFTPPPTGPAVLWIDAGIPWFSRRELILMPRLLRRLQPELLHIPTYWKPYLSPCPWVMTVHDLIHLLPPVSAQHRAYYALLRQQLRQRCALLLTVSEASATALRDWLGPGGPDIQVTRPGVEAAYQPAEGASTDDYALFVGNPKPHKAFELALRATEALGLPLRSVGVPHSGLFHHQALQAVPEAEMPALYQQARLLLLPSRQEGFGLPGLEALACGTPVLAADLPVLREVLGPAARYVPRHEAQSWQEALNTAWQTHDKQQPTWQQLARSQVARYSWQQLAAATLQGYRQCV